MTENLTDMFAAHALAGILAGGHCDIEEAAATAFRIADEMMAERVRDYLEPDAAPEARTTAVPLEDLPEWANWQATDQDGEIWVFETMPEDWDTCWVLGDKNKLIKKGPPCHDWRNSLIDLRPLRLATPYTGSPTEADRLRALNDDLLTALRLAVTFRFIPEVPPLSIGVTVSERDLMKFRAAKFIRDTLNKAEGR